MITGNEKMKPNLKLVEARGDDITFTFGRFNPPTVGHEKVMDATKSAATKEYRVYASKTQDPKKNPLAYEQKVKWMKKMFPKHKSKIQEGGNYRTALDVAVKLYDEGFLNLTMVVGSDRVREFNTLLKKYNGVESTHGLYDFKTIKVKSAGERDPDAEGVSGMSASKMRKAAMDNDFKSFSQGLPLNFRDGEKLFNDIKKKMPIKEFKEWDDDLEEASVMAVLGKKLFNKEYVSAVKMYNQFTKRGDKPAVAAHKAATTHRHVNEKELRKVVDAMGS